MTVTATVRAYTWAYHGRPEEVSLPRFLLGAELRRMLTLCGTDSKLKLV